MRDELQAQVDSLEARNTFPSRQALWRALAQTPWAQEKGLTERALETRAHRLGVAVRTPKGHGHRFRPGAAEPRSQASAGQVAHSSVTESAAGGAVGKAAPQRLSLPLLRQVVPTRYRRLVGKVEDGSLQAAIDLKCLDCSDYQVAEVRYCTVTGCPLHSVRPYQP